MDAYCSGMHDRRKSPVAVGHLALLKEPFLDGRQGFGFVRASTDLVSGVLPLDLLPEGDAVSVLGRLQELHVFEGLERGRAAGLESARLKVGFDRTTLCVRGRIPFRELSQIAAEMGMDASDGRERDGVLRFRLL